MNALRTKLYAYIANSQVIAIRDQKNVRQISNLSIKFKKEFICAAMTVTMKNQEITFDTSMRNYIQMT
jgi:hypothetical protein